MINDSFSGSAILIILATLAECWAGEAMIGDELISADSLLTTRQENQFSSKQPYKLLNRPNETLKYRQFNWQTLFVSSAQLPAQDSINSGGQPSHQRALELPSSVANELRYRGYIIRGNKRWALINSGNDQIVSVTENSQLLQQSVRVIEIHPDYLRLEQEFWVQEESRVSKRFFNLKRLSLLEEKHLVNH